MTETEMQPLPDIPPYRIQDIFAAREAAFSLEDGQEEIQKSKERMREIFTVGTMTKVGYQREQQKLKNPRYVFAKTPREYKEMLAFVMQSAEDAQQALQRGLLQQRIGREHGLHPRLGFFFMHDKATQTYQVVPFVNPGAIPNKFSTEAFVAGWQAMATSVAAHSAA